VRRLAFAVVLAALIAAVPATADESPIVGRGEVVGGRTAAQWGVAFDRWMLGRTGTELTSGTCLTAAAGDSVQFVAVGGPEDAHVVATDCTVPAGKYLFVIGPQMQCADVIPLPRRWRGPAGLRRCAREGWAKVADRHPRLVLDGNPIPTGAVVHSDAFAFTMPARDNVLGMPGRRHGHGAFVGRPTLIKPLSPGKHTLIQGIHYRIWHNLVAVYNLTVV
jgi:hypothetical protein